MASTFHCALSAPLAAQEIVSYIIDWSETSQPIDNFDDFISDIKNLILADGLEGRTITDKLKALDSDIQGYIPNQDGSEFGTYLESVSDYIMAAMPRGFFNENVTLGANPKFTIADALGNSILETVEGFKQQVSSDNTPKEEPVSSPETDNEPSFEPSDSEAFTDDRALAELLYGSKSEEDIEEEINAKITDKSITKLPSFIQKYFNVDTGDLMPEFHKYYVTQFYNKLISTKVGSAGVNLNLSNVFHELQQELREKARGIKGKTVSDLVNQGIETREAYFANVILLEYESVKSYFLKGVKTENNVTVTQDGEVRKGYGLDGSFQGLDQAREFIKMHIYTTPRMMDNGDGTFSQSQDRPFITEAELVNSFDILNSTDFDKTTSIRFVNSMEKWLKNTDDTNPSRPIIQSIYNRFFRNDNYTLINSKGDREQHMSLRTIASNQASGIISDNDTFAADNMLTAIYVFLNSQQNMEHIIVENGEVTITRTSNSQVKAQIKEDIKLSITRPNEHHKIKESIAKNIKFDSTTDKLSIGDVSFKFELTKGNPGKLINVTNDNDLRNLGSRNSALILLEKLGMPKYLLNNRKFITQYETLANKEFSLGEMIANLAYAIHINTDTGAAEIRQSENANDLIAQFPQNEAIDELLYPVDDLLYKMFDLISEAAEASEGITAKKIRLDLNSNPVAVIAPKARIYETNNLIKRIQNHIEDGNSSVHNGNPLVNGGVNGRPIMQIKRFAVKDGLSKYGDKRPNDVLTPLEHFKYAIEYNFFGYGLSTDFSESIFQPSVMSDRSQIPNAVVQLMQGSMIGRKSADRAEMRTTAIKAQVEYHRNLATQITTAWLNFFDSNQSNLDKVNKKLMEAFRKDVNADLPFSAIKALNTILNDAKLSSDDITSQKTLVDQLMYVKDGDSVKLKPLMLEMMSVMENPAAAGRYMDRQRDTFKQSLKDAGFVQENLDRETTENMASHKVSFEAIIESYFWRSITFTNGFNNLNMGSLYQFKGDIDPRLDNKTQREEMGKALVEQGFMGDRDYDTVIADKKLEAQLNSKITESIKTKQVAIGLSNAYINQVKRNAGQGSSYQWPELIEDNQAGKKMGTSTRTALISDPEKKMMNLLGSLSHLEQEMFDAAQFAHPLYFLRLNHSLGNNENQYSTASGQGKTTNSQIHGSVKDISNEIGPDGILRFQKKATFNMFSNEMLRKSPELQYLFEKMNTSIPFKEAIVVEKVGKNKYRMVNVDPNTVGDSDTMFTASNMHELWQRVGGIDNDMSWDNVLDVISSDTTGTVREAYVEKVGFISGEKTGNRGINSENVWTSRNNIGYGNELIYTEFSNRYHGVILNSDHHPDTTVDYSTLEEFENDHNNEVSLMTQVISAAMFQGETFEEAQNINDALQGLSQLQLSLIQEEATNHAYTKFEQALRSNDVDQLPGLPEGRINQLREIANKSVLSNEDINSYKSAFDQLAQNGKDYRALGIRAYAQELVNDAAQSRAQFGLVTELTSMPKVPFDSLQVNNILQSSIMGKLTRDTVRVRFRGGQYVVSPSEGLINLFTLPNGQTVTRDVYQRNTSVAKKEVKSIDDLISSDLVWRTQEGGKPVTYQQLLEENNFNKDIVKEKYFSEDEDNRARLYARLPEGKGEALKWMNYYTRDVEGKKQFINDVNHPVTGKIYEELDGLKVIGVRKMTDEQKARAGELQAELQDILSADDIQWETDDAEFYMPMMHQAAFNLRDGDVISGVADTDNCIMGEGLTEEEQFSHMEEFFRKRIIETFTGREKESFIKEAFKPLETGLQTTALDLKKLNNHYLELLQNTGGKFSALEISAMESIQKRIAETIKMYSDIPASQAVIAEGQVNALNSLIADSKYLFEKKADRKKYNIRSKFRTFRGSTVEDMTNLAQHYRGMLTGTNISQAERNSMVEILRTIEKGLNANKAKNPEDKFDPTLASNIKNFITGQRKNYVTHLAQEQARNFPKTLKFLVGRIPAQGKQSYVAGQVKGFITSQRNAVFGPTEMLTITGADHDIDKGNVKAYSVDKNGVLYNYAALDSKIGDEYLTKERYDEILEKELFVLKNALTEAGISAEKSRKRIHQFKKQKLEYYEEATKNFILDNLMAGIRSPKNAIEAATPISMDELKSHIDESGENRFEVNEDQETTYIDDTKSIFSPYNPASIPALESINLTGKAAIGVYATGIKGKSAIYNAFVQTLKDKSPEELKYLGFSNDLFDVEGKVISTDLEKLIKSEFGIDLDPSAITIFNKEQDLVNGKFVVTNIKSKKVTTIANASKFDENNQAIIKGAKALRKRWRDPNDKLTMKNTENEIVKLISQSNDLLMEPQGWEMLSQFLSAATDNAKELILGRIGATSTTNGIIATGIVLGFDIETILSIFTDNDVKQIVNKVEKSKDSTFRGKPMSLKKALEDSLTKKYGKDFSRINEMISTNAVDAASFKLQKLKGDINELQVNYVDDFNVNSMDEIVIQHYENADESFLGRKFNFGSLQKVSTIAPNEDTIVRLNNLGVTNPDVYPKFGTLLGMMDNSDVILTKEPMTDSSTSEAKFLKAYANETGKKIYSVQGTTWTDVNGNAIGSMVAGKTMTWFPTKKGNLSASTVKELRINTENLIKGADNYFKSIQEQIKVSEDAINSSKNQLRETAANFLTSKERQLLTLVKIADEMRALTGILSINQGLPNDSYGNYNFVRKFEKIVTEKVGNFSLNEFVKSLSSDGDYARKMINAYEPVKDGFNILYILSKNKQYLGYLESRAYGDEIIDSVSYTNKVLRDVADQLSEAQNAPRMGDREYKSVRNFIYGLGIEQYFEEKVGNFKINGEEFDLSTSIGRSDFIKRMPELLDEMVKTDLIAQQNKNDRKVPALKDNPFINKLKKGNLLDNRSKTGLVTLDMPSLINTDEVIKAQLESSLSKLKSEDAPLEHVVLHNALFYYTLIMNKGGRNKESFAALFDTGTFTRYTDFLTGLQEDEVKFNKFKKTVDELPMDMLQLANPGMIPVESTHHNNLKARTAEQMEAFAQQREEEGERKQQAAADGIRDGGSRLPNVYRSKETGDIYVKKNGKHIVVTPLVPVKAIPYTVNGLTPVEKAGYRFGKEAIVNSNGTKRNVLYYEGDSFYMLDDGTKISITDLKNLNENMYFDGDSFGMNTDRLSNRRKAFQSAIVEAPKGNQKMDILKGNARYMALNFNITDEDLDDKNEFLNLTWTLYHDGQAIPVKLRYLGSPSKLSSKIKNNLLNKRSNISQMAIKQGNMPIAEIVMLKTPIILDKNKYPVLDSSVVGDFPPNQLNNIKFKNATHALSAKPEIVNEIKEGETKLIKLNTANGPTYFEVTNKGKLNKFKSERGFRNNDPKTMDIFYQMFNYKRGEKNNKKLEQELNRDSSNYVFEFRPFNSKAHSINSVAELAALKGSKRLKENKDLSNIFPNVLSIDNAVDAEAKKFFENQGVRPVQITWLTQNKLNAASEEYVNNASKAAEQLSADNSNLELNNKVANAVEDADAIYMVARLKKVAGKDLQSQLNLNDNPNWTKETRQFKIQIENLYESEIHGDVSLLQDKINNILSSRPRIEQTIKDFEKKGITYTFNEVGDKLTELLNKLSVRMKVPTEIKEVAAKRSDFMMVQIAKEAAKDGKPFFIFDYTTFRWKKYNEAEGVFVPVSIPAFSNNGVLIGDVSMYEKESGAFESLLLKSAYQNLQATNGLGMPNDITDLAALSTEEVTESINVVESTDIEAIANTDIKVVNDEDMIYYETEVYEEGDTDTKRSKAPAFVVNEKPLFDKDFIKWDEGTVIKKFSDGAVAIDGSINGNPRFMVVMDDNLIDAYGGYTGHGDGNIENFALEIEGQKYYFPSVLSTDRKTFEKRDKLAKERKEIKAMYDQANSFFQEEVLPLYKEVRFDSTFTPDYNDDYGSSYKLFLKWLSTNGESRIDPNHVDTVKELISKNREYVNMIDGAANHKFKIIEKYNKPLELRTSQNSFFTDAIDKDVLVFLTDTANTLNEGVGRKALDKQKTGKRVIVSSGSKTGMYKVDGNITSYSISVVDAGGDIKTPKSVRNQIYSLIKAAESNKGKTFRVEMPANLEDKLIGDYTALDAAKAFALVLNNKKMKGLPDNLLFTPEFAALVQEMASGVDPSKINRTIPFISTTDMFEGALDITDRMSPFFKKWAGNKSIMDEFHARKGYPSEKTLSSPATKGSQLENKSLREAYKQLWREWFIKNPSEINKLATDIGARSIFDARIPLSENGFSTGQIIAELLTEKFVDNNWIDLPRADKPYTKHNPKVEIGQHYLPVPLDHGIEFDRSTKKAILEIDGRVFIATEYIAEREFKNQEIFESEAEQFGLNYDENLGEQIKGRYPFMQKGKSYTILALEESTTSLERAAKVKPGDYFAALQTSGVELTPHQEKAATEATVQFGFDFRRRITEGNNGFIAGTSWIDDIKSSLGYGVVTEDINSSDVVWLYGNKQGDGINSSATQRMFQAVQPFVDKAARVSAKIMVDRNNGMDEQIRAYVIANYPQYHETADGLEVSPTLENKSTLKLSKKMDTTPIERFNFNNFENREQGHIGAQGTVLYQDPSSDSAGGVSGFYNVDLDLEKDARNWNMSIKDGGSYLVNILRENGLVESKDADFTKVRKSLLVREQKFAERLLQLKLMRKMNLIFPVTSIADFDKFVMDLKAANNDFNMEYLKESSSIFAEEGRLNVSDVAKLAMIRNKYIANQYLQALNPLMDISDVENTESFELISNERNSMDKGSSYRNMINSNELSNSDLQLIEESENVSYADIYNFMMTIKPFRQSNYEGKLNAGAVNDFFNREGIKAFVDGDKIIVLDNSIISPEQKGDGKADINVNKKSTLTGPAAKFVSYSAFNAYAYKYMNRYGMIDFDEANNEIILTMDGFYNFPLTSKGANEAINRLQKFLLKQYYDVMPGINADEAYIDDLVDKPFLYGQINKALRRHIQYRSAVKGTFNQMFKTKPVGDIPTNRGSLKTFTLYNYNNKPLFVVTNREGDWYGQAENGELYILNSQNEWEVIEGVNNLPTSIYMGEVQNRMASPKGIGMTFNSLLTDKKIKMPNDQYTVREIIEEVDGETISIIEAFDTKGNIWHWNNTGRKGWTPTSAGAFKVESSESFVSPSKFTPGQSIISLDVAGMGPISLYNGVATTETKVEDDKGVYEYDSELGWSQTKIKGGFSNPDPKVRFSTGQIKSVQNNRRRIEAKKASPIMMRKLVNFLNDKLNTDIEALTSLDIEIMFGKEFANKNAFVTADGRIVVNTSRATMDAPMHEIIGHVYIDHLKANDPDTFRKIMDLSLQHPLSMQVAKAYGLKGDALAEETFATLFGLETQEMIEDAVNNQDLNSEDKPTSIWLSMKKLMKGFSDWFTGLFKNAFNLPTDSEFKIDTTKSLSDIIDQIGTEVAFGDGSFFENVGYSTQKQMRNISKTMTEEDMVEYLEAMGLIKIICT